MTKNIRRPSQDAGNRRLWAPWRTNYVHKKKSNRCIFCANKKISPKTYCFIKSRHSMAILNIYPYNAGHVMVAPLRHINDLSKLNQSEAIDLFNMINNVKGMLDICLKPQAYNIGINIGRSAGAGITGHLHIHIVPRWKGDSNFMTTVFDARVVSASLDSLYQKLIRHAR